MTRKILYSMPLPLSSISTLNTYAEDFSKPGTIAIMADNEAHLAHLDQFTRPPSVFLKIDTGTHRAGLRADSSEFAFLAGEAVKVHQAGKCTLLGIYSHASHSYAGRDAENAMRLLLDEINGCLEAEKHVWGQESASALTKPLVLSVGATPTATSAQNLTVGVRAGDSSVARELKDRLEGLRREQQRHKI
jgi:D-serine deaminase-like pyridoxal phosphate-dependent protein